MYYFDILESVYKKTVFSLYGKERENGGIIGAYDGTVIEFVADNIPLKSTEASYQPDISFLNKIIFNHWNSQGISFAGFVHSHLTNDIPSQEDILFVRNYMSRYSYSGLALGVLNCSTVRLSMYYVTINDVSKMEFNIIPRD